MLRQSIRTRATRSTLTIAGVLTMLGAAVAEAAAQQTGRPPAHLSGRAVDVTTGSPISGVLVVATPEPPSAGEERRTVTDSLGGYRIERLPAGRIDIVATGSGYHPLALAVEVLPGDEARVSLGLVPEPVVLEPIDVAADRPPPFRRAPEPVRSRRVDDDGDDLNGDHSRRALGTDVTALTRAAVEQAVTLAEPDVLRALLRLPSTATRSDYTAELWTRGAPWHQTRLYFDGVPLFGSLHALGMFSGFSPGSVGSLWFYPGVRPAAIGEGAAGAVNVGTRPGTGVGELNAEADLSLIGAAAALSQRLEPAGLRWMVSGRRTHAAWAPRALAPAGHELPWGFWDVTGRLDASVSHRLRFEASATSQRDSYKDDGQDVAHWSAGAARVTGIWTGPSVDVNATFGASRSRGSVAGSFATESPVAEPVAPSGTDVTWIGGTGTVRSRVSVEGLARWSAGYEVARLASSYQGLPPFPLPRPSSLVPETGPETTAPSFDRALVHGALWLEGVTTPVDRFSVQLGLRVERALNAGLPGTRPAPRVLAQWHAPASVTVSGGFGRTFQYVQALAPTGVHVASLSSSDVWMVAGVGVPVLRSDLATLALDVPLSGSWSAGLNVYDRRSIGVAMPDPTPGPLFARPLWVVGSERARGVEASVIRTVGSWTASASWAYTHAQLAARGLQFAAPSERPHVLDLTTRVRVGSRLWLGAALTAASGVNYTRVQGVACPGEEPCPPQPIPWVGVPAGERSPAYASLDLMADREWTIGGASIGAWAQLRNALGRDNGTWFTLARPGCSGGICGPRRVVETRYEAGLPRLPLVGVRARF